MSTAVQGSAFTPEEIQYWTTHKSDTLVPNIITCVTITAFFSTVFVVLRVLCRRLQYGAWKLLLNDWLVLIAWVFFVASDVSFAMLTPYGGGRHVIYITNPYKLQVFSILSESFYGLSMAFLKLSVLVFYGSIFNTSKTFVICLWIMAFFVAGWGLSAFLGGVLQCVPIAKAYNASLHGYCINYGQISLVVTTCNVVTDLIIIALPIPLVLKLHATQHRKNVIMLTFAAGSSAVIASIVRLVYSLNSAVIASIVRLVYSLNIGSVDGSWTAIPAGFTSCVELTTGFLVVSIPAYRVFYKRTLDPNGGSTWFSMKSGRTPFRSNENDKSDYNRNHAHKHGVRISSDKGASTDHIYKTASKGSSMVDQRRNLEYSVTAPTSNAVVRDGHSCDSIELERF